MTPADIERLIKSAKGAMKNSIVPFSKLTVGAALITKGNKIYQGCNIENPSLMLSVCAEKTALLSALAEGERAFKAIAVVSNKKDYCFPCGSCRQMIAEFAPDIEIYLVSKNGIKKFSINKLLPHRFKNR